MHKKKINNKKSCIFDIIQDLDKTELRQVARHGVLLHWSEYLFNKNLSLYLPNNFIIYLNFIINENKDEILSYEFLSFPTVSLFLPPK